MEVVQVCHSLDAQVIIGNVGVVTPCESTPSETLYLSNIDDMISSRFFAIQVNFYSSGGGDGDGGPKSVYDTLRNGLARALVLYYPLAGRLRDAESGAKGNGKLQLQCTGEGVLFVEALSHTSLADMGPFHCPNRSWMPFLYFPPHVDQSCVVDVPLLMAQVTVFRGGGFALGIRLCHCVCDGVGASQFVRAWAELSRGDGGTPPPRPVWGRELLRPRTPPRVEAAHAEFQDMEDASNIKSIVCAMWDGNASQTSIRLGGGYVRSLQRRARTAADGCADCSRFDAVAGALWRAWVLCMRVAPPQQRLRLTFSVNARPALALPRGFYGNAIAVACAVSTAADLAAAPDFARAAALVHRARRAVDERYVRSTVDLLETVRPQRLHFGAKLSVTQWSRLGIHDADFGWGRPLYAGPVDITATPQLCLLLPDAANGDADPDALVLCLCLPNWMDAQSFLQCMPSVPPSPSPPPC